MERIFTIWEERSVYPEELISLLKTTLARRERDREKEKDKEREREREKEKEREKVKEKESTPAAGKSSREKRAPRTLSSAPSGLFLVVVSTHRRGSSHVCLLSHQPRPIPKQLSSPR